MLVALFLTLRARHVRVGFVGVATTVVSLLFFRPQSCGIGAATARGTVERCADPAGASVCVRAKSIEYAAQYVGDKDDEQDEDHEDPAVGGILSHDFVRFVAFVAANKEGDRLNITELENWVDSGHPSFQFLRQLLWSTQTKGVGERRDLIRYLKEHHDVVGGETVDNSVLGLLKQEVRKIHFLE